MNKRVIICLSIWFCSQYAYNQGGIFSKITEVNDPRIDSLSQIYKYYLDRFHYDSSIIPLLLFIELNLENEDGDRAHSGRFQLAKIYYILGSYPKAVENLEYCQLYYKQNNLNLDYVRTCHLLSFVYYKMNNPEMAHYFLGQTEFEKPTSNNPLCKNEHLLLQAILLKESNLLINLDKLESALKFSKENNLKDLQVMCFEGYGDIYARNDEPVLACSKYEKCLELCQELHYLNNEAQLLYKIHLCLSAQKKFEEANTLLLNYIAKKDSLQKINQNENLLKSEKVFSNKVLRNEKIELAQDNRLLELKSRRSSFANIGLLITVAAILLAVFLIVRFYMQKLNTSEIILRQNEQINKQKIKELENSIKLNNLESMIKGQEEERERIAKDLHDSLGGILSTIKLRYDNLSQRELSPGTLSEISKVHDLIDEACAEVRNISFDLKPGALDELGLTEAIRDLLNRFENNKINIIFQSWGIDSELPVEPTVLTHIYRIVQELVNNSSKYSKSNEILVQLIQNKDQLEIIVEDDGIGFDESKIQKGMGLDNIRSRVNYLKGELSIKSEPNKGTSTYIVIPLENTNVSDLL
ncbi:MAG: hypothetical protein IT267_03365 [Saprospiraceae bacterium]|nr:hypothetical protein [Saprospiraceae bacterium]